MGNDEDGQKVVTLSSPGKVLMAGGYLVLESPNIGVVVAADKRFYSTVMALPEASTQERVSSLDVSLSLLLFIWFKRKNMFIFIDSFDWHLIIFKKKMTARFYFLFAKMYCGCIQSSI